MQHEQIFGKCDDLLTKKSKVMSCDKTKRFFVVIGLPLQFLTIKSQRKWFSEVSEAVLLPNIFWFKLRTLWNTSWNSWKPCIHLAHQHILSNKKWDRIDTVLREDLVSKQKKMGFNPIRKHTLLCLFGNLWGYFAPRKLFTQHKNSRSLKYHPKIKEQRKEWFVVGCENSCFILTQKYPHIYLDFPWSAVWIDQPKKPVLFLWQSSACFSNPSFFSKLSVFSLLFFCDFAVFFLSFLLPFSFDLFLCHSTNTKQKNTSKKMRSVSWSALSNPTKKKTKTSRIYWDDLFFLFCLIFVVCCSFSFVYFVWFWFFFCLLFGNLVLFFDWQNNNKNNNHNNKNQQK